MAEPDAKTGIKLKVNIRPGQVSPAQRHAWKCFWSKVISTTKDEVRGEQQRNQKAENESEGESE